MNEETKKHEIEIQAEGDLVSISLGPGIRSTPKLGELFAAVAKAQLEFTVVEKTEVVDFVNKKGQRVHYKYASLGDLLEMMRPYLNKQEVAFLQPPTNPMNGFQYVTTIMGHSSGQWISSTQQFPVEEQGKFDPHVTGNKITYLRRYTASGTASVATEEDDDGNLGAGDANPDKRPRSQSNGSAGGSKGSNGKENDKVIPLSAKEQQDVLEMLKKFKEREIKTHEEFGGYVASIKKQSEGVRRALRKPAMEYQQWLNDQSKGADSKEPGEPVNRTPAIVKSLATIADVVKEGETYMVSRVFDDESVVVEIPFSKTGRKLLPQQYEVVKWNEKKSDQPEEPAAQEPTTESPDEPDQALPENVSF